METWTYSNYLQVIRDVEVQISTACVLMLDLCLDLLCYAKLQGAHLAKSVWEHIHDANTQSQGCLDPESSCVCQGSLTTNKLLFLTICKQVTSADV